MGFIIHHVGKYGSACVDTQIAPNAFEAVCLHRRFFSGRVISVQQIRAATAKLWSK